MGSRGAAKYGKDSAGAWGRDDEGLPCYDWDLPRLARSTPSWPHLLGTGHIQVTADQWGAVRVLAGPAAGRVAVNALSPGCFSALRLDLHVAGRILRLLPLAAPAAWRPQARYGCGYVSYDLAVREPGIPLGLDLRLELVACPGKPFVLLEIAVRPGAGEVEVLPCLLTVASDLGDHGPPGAPTPALFARAGAAMASLGAGLDDAFLAGSSGWDSTVAGGRLELSRALALRPQEAVSMRLLLGYSASCSLQWLRQQFEGLTVDAVKAQRLPVLRAPPVPGLELWMREDLVWCRAALSAYQAFDAQSRRVILHPVSDAQSPRTAQLLALCPLLQRVFPEVVQDTIAAVALRQGPAGQLPERLGGPLPNRHPDPERDRSDTEIAFLWACACWLSEPGQGARSQTCLPAGVPHSLTLIESAMLAAAHVREGIGCGPHGLIRLLAGDWNGALDRAGRAGAGESVLNTMQYCAALRLLAEALRQGGHRADADRLDTWQRPLAAAVADAHRGDTFLRGYTDVGTAIGDPGNGPLFIDVQAWAVLARCGTVSQRRAALDAVLAASADRPLTAMTTPYPASWPAGLSRAAVLPGEGLNAGVSLLEAAWFLRALVLEGRSAEAMNGYREVSLRRRCSGPDRAPFPAVALAGRVNGPAAQAAAWWPETSPAVDAAAAAVAVAWQEDTLHAILTSPPGA
jgi:hypothetical protein